MDPIDREVLALRHFEELSNDETAQVLGLSKTAASNRYVRALKRLKEILAGHARASSRPEPGPAVPARVTPWRRATRSRTATRSSRWPRSSSSGTAAASTRARRVRRAVPRAGRGDPRAVPGPGDDGAAQARTRGPTGTSAAPPAAGRPRPLGAAGRLPHPPRDRPRRHGGRLRGRAGVAGPPRGAEGPARRGPDRPRRRCGGSSARPGRRRGCTTPTSCRSSASASRTASTTTPCSSSPGLGLDAVLEELRRLRGGGRRRRPRPATARRRPRPRRCGSPRPSRRGAADRPVRDRRGRRRRRAGRAGDRRDRRRADRAASAPRRRPTARAEPSRRGRRPRSAQLAGRPGRAGLLPRGGPDRRAGGRGAGLRPPPGRRSTATSSPRTCCSTPRATSGSTDFGLAKPDEGEDLTQTRRHRRHPPLHGPGAVPGRVRPPRATSMRLGVTLYELLALRPAFDEPDRPG